MEQADSKLRALALECMPELNHTTLSLLETYCQHIRDWNTRINLVSRKNIDVLEEQHLLPCLSIAKICTFKPGTRFIDVGTGGGFPGFIMALCFPHCHFTLMDSIKKKIMVLEDIKEKMNIKNVTLICSRIENHNAQYDFALGRAVTDVTTFWNWVKKNVKPGKANTLHNGLLYLSGGDMSQELKGIRSKDKQLHSIPELLGTPHAEGKCLVHIAK